MMSLYNYFVNWTNQYSLGGDIKSLVMEAIKEIDVLQNYTFTDKDYFSNDVLKICNIFWDKGDMLFNQLNHIINSL
jgi:hypothetical protein